MKGSKLKVDLTDKIRINDKSLLHQSEDSNGFLIIKSNPIAKAGVFEYLLSEIKSDKIAPEDDRVVKVYRSLEELKRIKDSFANKPIKMYHSWVGEDSPHADGSIGSNITVDSDNEYLIADLIIYNPELIDKIKSKQLVELSPAYTGKEIEERGRYKGQDYEYRQILGEVNHLAVVEVGRSGRDLKIYDSISSIGELMKFKDSLIQAFSRYSDNELEKAKDIEPHESQDEEIDKREIIREIMALANKSNEDFQGGEDEKLRTISELAEKLAYSSSDRKSQDEVTDTETSIESLNSSKMDNDEMSEVVTEAIEKIDVDELVQSITKALESLVDKKLQEYSDNQKVEAKKVSDAYFQVKRALGSDFDSMNMSPNDIYKFGYETLSNHTLDKKMDAKTAFLLALDSKSQGQNRISDSYKQSPNSSILKILNEKY